MQAAVVEQMHVERAADLLEEMPPDEAADILGDLPEERLQAVLDAMEEEDAEEVRELLAFREDSAGGLMTTEFFQRERRGGRPGDVREALQRSTRQLAEELDEMPVVDEDGKLVGIVAARAPRARRPAAAGRRPRADRETRAVTTSAPFREVVERFEKYHLRGARGRGRVRRAQGAHQHRGRARRRLREGD